MATKDEMLVDKRIIERNIDKGMLSREDYATYLEKLPDAAANAEYVTLDEPEEPGEQEDAETPADTPSVQEPQA